MLTINRLRLQLPSGFEHRAGSISQQINAELKTGSVVESRNIEQLKLGRIQVSQHDSDRQIAQAVAKRILTEIGGL